MSAQTDFYQNKLTYEMDPSDLYDALNNGENIIAVDARKPHGFEAEHIPGAITQPKGDDILYRRVIINWRGIEPPPI